MFHVDWGKKAAKVLILRFVLPATGRRLGSKGNSNSLLTSENSQSRNGSSAPSGGNANAEEMLNSERNGGRAEAQSDDGEALFLREIETILSEYNPSSSPALKDSEMDLLRLGVDFLCSVSAESVAVSEWM